MILKDLNDVMLFSSCQISIGHDHCYRHVIEWDKLSISEKIKLEKYEVYWISVDNYRGEDGEIVAVPWILLNRKGGSR